MNDRGQTPCGDSTAKMAMRISYLLQQFPLPTETFAVSDIAALIEQGHDLTVHTMKLPPRSVHSPGIPDQLRIVRPTLSGALSWPGKLWRWRRESAWLAGSIVRRWRSAPAAALQALLCIPRLVEIADWVDREQCDVVHAFWSRHVGLTLALLKRRAAHVHRTAFVGAYDLVADDFILDLTTEAAQVLFSHAEVNRPFLERKAPPGVPVAIVHRGIPLIEPDPAIQREAYRLITASALVESKNVDGVIRSFAEARERESRLTLDIYGDGPDRARLQKLAGELGCAKAVKFGGHIGRGELFREMQRASIFLILSKKPSERLPNVLKEAMWAGCGVITSTSEGIEELVPDPSFGFVVDPDDPHVAASAISALLEETPGQLEARRSKARAFIAANFSSDASMRRYVETWRRRFDRPVKAVREGSDRPSVS